jgi:hypothetical protein
MARQKKVEVPEIVEQFFAALQRGEWNEIETLFTALDAKDPNGERHRLPEVQALWSPIVDAYGAAEQAHLWPAQKLLDYGNAVLGSLRPGMVYVGGTDEGRWVPALMNESSDEGRHVVITQNALADNTYLDYVQSLYGDQLKTLTAEDSRHAFADYMTDVQKRYAHDQQFPDEPKQIRKGEQVSIVDNRTSVGGQVAVMDINERLLRALMDKNPEFSFALQESFPLKGTYADAAPLGPIMELRAQDQSTFTPERAAQCVDYWRGMADQLRAAPDDSSEQTASKSFSKLAVGQGNLLAERGLSAQAEQTYRIATEMYPGNVEAAIGLSEVLARTGRSEEARRLLGDFVQKFPNQRGAVDVSFSITSRASSSDSSQPTQ